MNTIFLVVGPSGSGKTTLCNKLEDAFRLKVLDSYTTRAPRYVGENGHIFVDSYQKWRAQNPDETIVGITVFGGYRYWATANQVDKSDLYVIDPAGIEFFREKYNGEKQVKVVYVQTNLFRRFARMRAIYGARAAMKRLLRDGRQFHGWRNKADYVVKNQDLSDAFASLSKYIRRFMEVEG